MRRDLSDLSPLILQTRTFGRCRGGRDDRGSYNREVLIKRKRPNSGMMIKLEAGSYHLTAKWKHTLTVEPENPPRPPLYCLAFYLGQEDCSD